MVTDVAATDERLGTLRGVLAGQTEARRRVGAGVGVRRSREHSVLQLARIGAGALDADLVGETVPVGLAGVATLIVDAADLPLGTVGVGAAVAFVGELADGVRFDAGDTARPGRAVAARGALRVTGAERADQRRVAVAVQAAPL